jgi:hypothetical protein
MDDVTLASWNTGTIMLCDPCWEAGTGLRAECADYCSLDLNHDGLCDDREHAGVLTECEFCGKEDRLTTEDRVNLDLDAMRRLNA